MPSVPTSPSTRSGNAAAAAASATQLLRRRGLRSTPARRAVLDRLLRTEAAVPQCELSEGTDADRITLYRTLRRFEELGIVHRVLGTDGQALYALCGGECTAEAHVHQHPHFSCGDCKQVFCLPAVASAPPVLPEGYQATGVSVTYEGRCRACGDVASGAATRAGNPDRA